MSARVITVSGPPGSGKTTAGRLAASLAGLGFVSVGERFRAEATRRGLSVAGLSLEAERDPAIDRELDESVLRDARPGMVIDGRITGALLRQRGIPVFYAVVTAPRDVRARRVAERDGVPIADAEAATARREASEQDRYRRYYQIDLTQEPVDVTLDSGSASAEAVARELVLAARSAGAT